MACKYFSLDVDFQGMNHAKKSVMSFANGKIIENTRMRIAMRYNFAVHIRLTE
jgi:hypothetical protein